MLICQRRVELLDKVFKGRIGPDVVDRPPDLLNRLYMNPKTGSTLIDEIRAWASNLRQFFDADDVRTVISREIKKFRTEKFADGGHYVKQMEDNRDAIIEKLKSGLSSQIQEMINREGMAASADQILKEIVALVDDPQDAYIPYLYSQGQSLEKIEKRSQKQHEHDGGKS